MTRRLLTGASVLSLLLCVGAVVLWGHSRGRWDIAYRKDERQLANAALWLLAASRGSIWVYHERYDARLRQNRGPQLDRGAGSVDEAPFELTADPTWNSGGENEFRHRWPAWAQFRTASDSWQMLIVPLWCVVAVTAILPGLRTALWLRAASRKANRLCACRGYDLRASAERCPECGTSIPERTAG